MITKKWLSLQLMKRLVTYLMAVLVLAGCLGGCVSRERYAAMRQGLDSINMVNRSGQPFTVQDVEPYVEFFDDHGEANDRLLAHYLLGLAYYDHGEAPMALQCYQDALDCADTTRTDCDYAQLSRVYGKMAEIFYDQRLYRKELAFEHNAEKNAWLGKDTVAALSFYEHRYLAYNKLGLIDSAIFVVEDVAYKYEQYGYPTDASIALGAIIKTLIDKGEYKKAKEYMNRYESESGRFNSSGDIERGREIYYYIKGLYYLYNNVLDSAEYYFRKELCDGKDFDNQHAAAKGLSELYQQLHQPDSMAKYYQYAYAMNDSVYAHQTTETLERMQAMYDYSRHQNIAHQEKEKATLRAAFIWLLLAAFLLSACLGYFLFRRQQQKRREELRVANAEYSTLLLQYHQAQQNLHRVEENLEQFREEQEQQILSFSQRLAHYQEAPLAEHWQVEQAMLDSPVIAELHSLARRVKKPSKTLWQQMCMLIRKELPTFYGQLEDAGTPLTQQERLAAILIRLQFSQGEVAALFDVSKQRVNNIKSSLNRKLFNKEGAKSLETNIINM